jgi:hypothetical protein
MNDEQKQKLALKFLSILESLTPTSSGRSLSKE